MTEKKSDFDIFWQKLKDIIIDIPSTDVVFNQYRDFNMQIDLPDAGSIRFTNLHNYMADVFELANILIVGEAAGPWGCRFSGIPFTGEKQLIDPSFPIKGHRSSKDILNITTKISPPFISRSAEAFWELMSTHYKRFIVWDIFPLHSHKQNQILTVRNPSKKEVSQFTNAIELIILYIKPIQVIAIGKKAFNGLTELGIPSIYVRHPSRGGRSKFIDGMNCLFN